MASAPAPAAEAKRVVVRPGVRRTAEISKIIWTSGVIELLQRENTHTNIRFAVCNQDTRNDTEFAAGSEDIIRLGEAFFPLRALVAKRCQLLTTDYYNVRFHYVLRLGCPNMICWLSRHGKGERLPLNEEERSTWIANALRSRSLETVSDARRWAVITKEDCRSLIIHCTVPPNGSNTFLAAACSLTSVAVIKTLIADLHLEKRDFFDSTAN